MRIAFVHYNFGYDGVSRVVQNNIRYILEAHPEHQITLVGSKVDIVHPRVNELRILGLGDHHPHKTYADLEKKATALSKRLKRKLSSFDRVIVENATICLYPVQTYAYKMFAESRPTDVTYRPHDPVEEKLKLLQHMLELTDGNYQSVVYAQLIKYLAISNRSLAEIRQATAAAPIDIQLLPNSVVPEEFKIDNLAEVDAFRKRLIDDGLVRKGEHILLSPGRIIKRKNIEEAMLMTAARSVVYDQPHVLLVTMKELRYKEDRDYLARLEKIAKALAKDFKVRFVLGGINTKYDFLGNIDRETKPEFELKHMYAAADTVITTSTYEGFGYSFIEPFLTETPVIGRQLDGLTDDFTSNGIDLSGLYSRLVVKTSRKEVEFGQQTTKRRLAILRNITPEKVRWMIENNQLEERLKGQTPETVATNRARVIENYNYRAITRRLLEIIG